jgi:uroporphyrinogen decarboxylase-like protein
MDMTGRQRILAAFRGEAPDTVPFSPNIYYWFYHHLMTGQLPSDVAGARHPFDVLRFLGADILARWDTQRVTRERLTAGEYSEEFRGDSAQDQPAVTAFNVYPPHTSERHSRFATPYGTLTQTWILTEEAGADFIADYWWKDWSEYDAVRFMLESTEYEFDAAGFHRWVKLIGDDGVMMVHATQSPLKTFHWLAGAENATLFALDHPEEMKALARIHEEKALALLEGMVDTPDAEVFVCLDNLDSAFYPPYFYRDYCDSFFTRAAEIVHRRGKIFVVHACGHSKALMPLVGRSGVDCLEGLTPPPLGDVALGEARRMSGRPDYTVNGGMDTLHLELKEDAEARLHDYTRRLFESMGDKRHFVFASSCATPTLTPWSNLVHFRNAAREYGRLDVR